ncbi:ATP-dependent nuclease [Minwuia thermotolerans]|uniref:Uncharacterized protein n=1 Tax=Minwuia thermotolerans TaxID=2056226 RepID=A0A2M9G6A3_9PROT|nr:AAA family ATPase [Minwuia thermotolerans]PJK31249.1 hypothetical protein CVT23_03195 [Minwuia thermotolerans]
MKIKQIKILNFRSIKDQVINCGDQTIFIGANGVGKSTVLKALQAFFEISFRPAVEDFFAHNTEWPIEITIVFNNFSEDEAEDFKSRIYNDEMVVTRVFGGDQSNNGNYYGMMKGNPAFQSIRNAANATEAKAKYTEIQGSGVDLPKWTKQGDVEEHLTFWEAGHPDDCEFIRDGGQFFGFKSVGGGKLQKATNFILIEAVRDVSEDANDQKSSAIGQLMDLIVRSAMAQNEKIAAYQDEVNRQYSALTSPENFPQLGSLQTALTTSLRTYYQGVGVILDWREGAGINLPPPQAEIKFEEEKFQFPVAKAGNGIQRAFIISLLHQLLVVKSNSDDGSKNSENGADSGEGIEEKNFMENLPSVILAIEEPELYQHPTKQWHFAQVLKKLSTKGFQEIFGDVQVLFCTHSPSFVDLSEFHNTRIVAKVGGEGLPAKESIFREASLQDVSYALTHAWDIPEENCTDKSTKARLHIFGTELSEGFFADGVILVEGATDKAAFDTIGKRIGINFAERNISVLPVNEKNNLDKPFMVFKSLDIPVYPIWDSDGNCAEGDRGKAIKANKGLQKMLGVPDGEVAEFPEGVHEKYACFANEISEQLKNDFGQEQFLEAYNEAMDEFSLTAKQARKNPYVTTAIITKLYDQGRTAGMLEAIIQAAINHIENGTPTSAATVAAE